MAPLAGFLVTESPGVLEVAASALGTFSTRVRRKSILGSDWMAVARWEGVRVLQYLLYRRPCTLYNAI